MPVPGLSRRGRVSEQQLRALLDHDHSTTGIVTCRNGRIHRSYYASRLERCPSAVTQFGGVFADYEQRLALHNGPLNRLGEIREWLSSAYKAQALEIWGGKLDRAALKKRFNIKEGIVARLTPINDLFDEFDQRARREGYLAP